MKHVLAVLVVGAMVAGCNRDAVKRLQPQASIVDAAGMPRSAIDFGQAQINNTVTHEVLVHNSGDAFLSVNEVRFTNPLFGLETALPFDVDPGTSRPLLFTFRPVDADQRITAQATIVSNDPNKGEITVDVAGTGIRAVAVPMPAMIQFGEVYASETGTRTFVLTNAGSSPLQVADAQLMGVGAVVTGDLAALKTTVPGGMQVSTVLSYKPTAIADLSGELVVTLAGELGTLRIPVAGKGIQALPKLCVKLADEPNERCTGPGADLLDVSFGALCDNRIYPPSSGGCSSDAGTVPSSRAGTLYFKNDGNTPVSYTVRYDVLRGGRCDGGSSTDFTFSNARDGGVWTEGTVKLPTMPGAASSTTPVDIVYRPFSSCVEDGADQAQVIWTRQGEPGGTNRLPVSLFATIRGASQLPRGVPQDINITATIPGRAPFIGTVNQGTAPLRILKVELAQRDFLADGGRSAGPDLLCSNSGGTADCGVFSWDTNGDPNALLPVVLPPVDAGMASPRQLGTVLFGGPGGATPVMNTRYKVFAVITTNDPYNPVVVSTIEAQRQ